jgi:hypothetical protein
MLILLSCSPDATKIYPTCICPTQKKIVLVQDNLGTHYVGMAVRRLPPEAQVSSTGLNGNTR